MCDEKRKQSKGLGHSTPTRLASSILKEFREKPKLRGVSHLYATVVVLIAGGWLAAVAPTTSGALSSLAFSGSLLVQFTVSGLYHTVDWSPDVRLWLRRADHAAIFILIAGTYTPVCTLALHGSLGKKLLILVWAGAGVGVLQSLFFVQLPKVLTAFLYLGLGWLAARYKDEIVARTGFEWARIVLAGGILYSLGAFAYMLKWPNPIPKVFGYHEVFHVFVILAAATHFVAVAQLVFGSEDGKRL